MSTRETGGNAFVTPPKAGDTFSPHPAEMIVVEHENDTLEVHDPLFDQPYRFGDRSLITDPTADDYIVAHWQHHGVHASIRQLSNTEPFETKIGTGRWSRMQHMLSAAAITATHGGDATHIMRMATHDSGHRRGSHNTDDLLAGRGSEDAHDHGLDHLMTRNGFVGRLIASGLVDPQTHVMAHGEPLHHVVNETDTRSFTNHPSSTGLVEVERLQYITHEGAIWIDGPDVMREALQSVYRVLDAPEGDMLVFDNLDAAELISVAQTRCFTEHWSDQVNDIIDELLAAINIRVLSDKTAGFSTYSPADSFYMLEEDWESLYSSGSSSGTRHFVTAMRKIIDPLTALQRRAHAEFDSHSNRYSGPVIPDWMSLPLTTERMVGHHQRTTHERHAQTNENQLVIQMAPGKARHINPVVKVPGRDFVRLESARPSLQTYRQEQSRWAGYSYDAVINLDHSALNLTVAEKAIISRVLRKQDEQRTEILQRPLMPDELLAQKFKEAGQRYRQIGQVPLNSVLPDLRLSA